MARVYIPPMKAVPNGATAQDKQRMYEEYKAELIRLNPSRFNQDGSLKTFWQFLKAKVCAGDRPRLGIRSS